MSEVFLLGRRDGDDLCTDMHGKIVLAVLSICGKPKDFTVSLVNCTSVPQTDVSIDYESKVFEVISKSVSDFYHISCAKDFSDIHEEVSMCSLPLVRKSFAHVISGLCQVLREIIKHCAVAKPELGELLGHKRNCLQACSQVSVWTRLCELDFPDTLAQLQASARAGEALTLPEPVLKLEQHFREPPVVANLDKRIRNLGVESDDNYSREVRLAAEEEVRRKLTGLVSYIPRVDASRVQEVRGGAPSGNAPPFGSWRGIRHVFVEGCDVTLSDVAVYPCVRAAVDWSGLGSGDVDQVLPCVASWLDRMEREVLPTFISDEDVSELVASCRPPSEVAGLVGGTPHVPPAPQYDLGLREPKKVKNFVKEVLLRDTLATLEKSNVKGEVRPHPCLSKMPLNWESLPPAAHPHEGNLPAKRVARKCQQLESLATAAVDLARPGDVIVDFCAGSGHLGLLLAHLLPECRVLLVENKEASIRNACFERAKSLGLKNLTVLQSNLDYLTAPFDLGVCLHGCGVATDMVLARCVDAGAVFVVAPCCYGGIRDSPSCRYPRSSRFSSAGLEAAAVVNLGHAADQTELGTAVEGRGKACMALVDTDRMDRAKEAGYDVTLTHLHPLSCSPKNNLLLGAPAGRGGEVVVGGERC